jgi:tRNA G26 N,N-dimethylase Trm1
MNSTQSKSNQMTFNQTLYNVSLTENEISVILYYLEEVANRSKEEYDPEIDTIFDKLQSVGYSYS